MHAGVAGNRDSTRGMIRYCVICWCGGTAIPIYCGWESIGNPSNSGLVTGRTVANICNSRVIKGNSCRRRGYRALRGYVTGVAT